MIKSIERLAEYWALIGGLLLILIVVVTSWNVGAFTLDKIARIFGANVAALPGYEDFVRLIISAAALMFFPYCQLKRGHVAVDLFVSRFPRSFKEKINQTWLLVTAGTALFLMYWMIKGIIETHSDGVSSPVLGLAEWPFYIPGIISLLLWAVVAAMQAFTGQKHV